VRRYKEYSQKKVLYELRKIGGKLKLPRHMMEEWGYLYMESYNKGLTRGVLAEEVLMGILYYLVLKYNHHLTLKELEKFGVMERDILRSYRRIRKGLGLKYRRRKGESFLQKFGSVLGMKQSEITKAGKVMDNLEGCSPVVGAAGSLYWAHKGNGGRKSQKEFSEACGVSALSLRRVYKKLITD